MSATTGTVSIDDTFGIMTLGGLLAMALWGSGSVQVYYYFDRFTSDSLYLKGQVFAVWALETVHQAFVLGAAYKYLVTHYADVTYLETFESMLCDAIILTGVIAVIVQMIFVDRIYLLSKKNLTLTGATATLALGQLICTILHYAKAHSVATFDELRSVRTFMWVDNAVTAAADISIAATLLYLFHTTKTGFKKNDSIGNKILAFALNTGATTAVVAILCLIMTFALEDTFVYLFFYYILARLYMNSVMSSLNSRSIRSGGSNTDSSGTPGRNFRMTDMRDNRPELSSYSIRPAGGPRIVTIKVDTETILDQEAQKEISRQDSDIEGDGYGPSYSHSKGQAI
ncbi:hypothetical protein ACEPAG_2907 [Sanghuangporus baumii]